MARRITVDGIAIFLIGDGVALGTLALARHVYAPGHPIADTIGAVCAGAWMLLGLRIKATRRRRIGDALASYKAFWLTLTTALVAGPLGNTLQSIATPLAPAQTILSGFALGATVLMFSLLIAEAFGAPTDGAGQDRQPIGRSTTNQA